MAMPYESMATEGYTENIQHPSTSATQSESGQSKSQLFILMLDLAENRLKRATQLIMISEKTSRLKKFVNKLKLRWRK